MRLGTRSGVPKIRRLNRATLRSASGRTSEAAQRLEFRWDEAFKSRAAWFWSAGDAHTRPRGPASSSCSQWQLSESSQWLCWAPLRHWRRIHNTGTDPTDSFAALKPRHWSTSPPQWWCLHFFVAAYPQSKAVHHSCLCQDRQFSCCF